jgi:two-component system OmpR family response regulator
VRLLIVEDEADLAQMLADGLRHEGFGVDVAGDGASALALLGTTDVDVVVLDRDLPVLHGDAVCRALVAAGHPARILMLTASGTLSDRVTGLDLGADDYLAKPFNPRELLARIRAILRRVSAEVPDTDERRRLHFSGWTLDVSLRQVLSPEGARIAVTGAEFDLLHALCLRPGRVLSRDQLLDLTQGRTAGPFERSIDVLISRIRQKIERDTRNPEFIRTIRSGGYLFTPEVTRS